MIFSIIAAVLIFMLVLSGGFFRLAFIRKDDPSLTDVNSPINNFLGEHKDAVKKGIKFIRKSYSDEVFTDSFDGLKLYAKYFDAKSEKTIILFHGYRSAAERDFSCAVEMYMKLGLNVLLCDQRAHGKSEGKIICFGVKERRDVLSWIEFYKNNISPDHKIFLGGMSMGATTVLLSVGLGLPENVKGIIADCGFTSPVAIIKRVARQHFKINGSFIIFLINLYCLVFGKFSLYGVSTAESLKNTNIPVIFIHGKSDNFVPPEMSREGYDSLKGKKRILLIDKAGHGMSFLFEPEDVRQEITKFLVENL